MEDELQKTHHIRDKECTTRPAYREGRKQKAIKVYTVSQESLYLLVQGVPENKLQAELVAQFAKFGHIVDCTRLADYPTEKFKEVYLLKFARLQSARVAKKHLDDYNFYGGTLHVCYAPEYESIEETAQKLQDRKKSVIKRICHLRKEEKKNRIDTKTKVPAPQPTDVHSVTRTCIKTDFPVAEVLICSRSSQEPPKTAFSKVPSNPLQPLVADLYPHLPPIPQMMPPYLWQNSVASWDASQVSHAPWITGYPSQVSSHSFQPLGHLPQTTVKSPQVRRHMLNATGQSKVKRDVPQ